MAIRDIAKQIAEVSGQSIPHDEVLGALRSLEADGKVQFNERNQSVFVRSGIKS